MLWSREFYNYSTKNDATHLVPFVQVCLLRLNLSM